MDVKFYPNDPTNLHCVQATFQMILSKLLPEREFSMEELVRLSNIKEGQATWPSRLLIELDKLGLELVIIEGFNARCFIDEGGEYLRGEFGEEATKKHYSQP